MVLQLVQIPVWRDNYAYLVHDGARAFVVDSPEAAPVLECLAALPGVRLEAVVVTHHHGDHVGGNRELVAKTGCAVVGPAHDRARIPGITVLAAIGGTVNVAGVSLRVLDVHAHTRGHVAYACDTPIDVVIRHGHGGDAQAIARLAGRPALFVGDSLFAAGCGRLFEGTPEDLARALATLAVEDPRALVCCAHEYTSSNLRFATHVLPDHEPLRGRALALAEEMRGTDSSVPDTLARELETNPFLLALDGFTPSSRLGPGPRRELARRFQLDRDDAVTVIGRLRAAKDAF